MYDPLIVDTFVANLARLTDQIKHESEPRSIGSSPRLLAAAHPEFPSGGQTTSDCLDAILDVAISQTGANLAVIFAADRDRDYLVSVAVRRARGTTDSALAVPIGSGISGWVAANGTPILNADPCLDFRDHPPLAGLVRSICVPIVIRGLISGVISMYTDDPRGFSEDDQLLLQNLTTRFEVGQAAESFDGMLRVRQSASESARTVH